MSSAYERIPSLDGLRAVAISMVVLDHVSGTKGFFIQDPDGKAHLVLAIGQMGVRIFFVISGFLITTLLRKETISLPRFYLRRTLRIFPAFYVFVVAMCLAHIAGFVSFSSGALLHAVSYTTNYSGGSWVLGHLWSLSVEEQFYLIWPAVLLLLGWRRSVAGVAVFILALPAARLGFRLFPSACTACQAFVPVWADGIAVGCLLAAARGQLNAQRLYRSFKGSAWFLAVPVAVVLGTVLSAYPNAWSPLITRTLTNICIALIIDRSIDVPRDLAGRMLNSRPMCFIGVLSYSLYLWQQPFLDHYSSSLVCTFPLNILLALGAALASYYAVEKPFLAWRKKLERRWFTAPDVRGHDAVVLV